MKKNKKNISLSEIYHENTKLAPHVIKNPLITNRELAEFMVSSKKEYAGCKSIKLEVEGELKLSLEETLKKRRSIREFIPGYIDFSQLSKILSLSYGPSIKVKLNNLKDNSLYTFRTSPSAGALYACNIYILSSKVKGLDKGIFHFNADKLQLELLKKGDLWQSFIDSLPEQPYAKDVSCAIIITADFSKIKHKYGERGYRYVFLDAGHIGENIYLTATALDLGVVGVGGFYDDKVNKLLSVDGYNESVIYILLLGRRS